MGDYVFDLNRVLNKYLLGVNWSHSFEEDHIFLQTSTELLSSFEETSGTFLGDNKAWIMKQTLSTIHQNYLLAIKDLMSVLNCRFVLTCVLGGSRLGSSSAKCGIISSLFRQGFQGNAGDTSAQDLSPNKESMDWPGLFFLWCCCVRQHLTVSSNSVAKILPNHAGGLGNIFVSYGGVKIQVWPLLAWGAQTLRECECLISRLLSFFSQRSG